MAKKRSDTERNADETADKGGPTVLYLRLSKQERAALAAYIAAQEVQPDKQAVGRTALRQFLGKHGFWPPKE